VHSKSGKKHLWHPWKPTAAKWHLHNPRYTPHSDASGQLNSITDSNGKQVAVDGSTIERAN
jgi:hypothetical protein